MFEDYLNNIDTYDELERFLANEFERALALNGLHRNNFKLPHYNNHCIDGTKIRDANPIFSASHKITHNILRVVIFEEVGGGYSTIHNSAGDHDELSELLLVMKISRMKHAMHDILKWAKEQESLSAEKPNNRNTHKK